MVWISAASASDGLRSKGSDEDDVGRSDWSTWRRALGSRGSDILITAPYGYVKGGGVLSKVLNRRSEVISDDVEKVDGVDSEEESVCASMRGCGQLSNFFWFLVQSLWWRFLRHRRASAIFAFVRPTVSVLLVLAKFRDELRRPQHPPHLFRTSQELFQVVASSVHGQTSG